MYCSVCHENQNKHDLPKNAQECTHSSEQCWKTLSLAVTLGMNLLNIHGLLVTVGNTPSYPTEKQGFTFFDKRQ